ncbi:hypothetical protein E4U21_002102 [Claviceps maximensis]|nr:hypothetical protein E4U21_002102 [Claviceps maximensis]
MSLPTTKPVQSSIRSFFTSGSPKYAPPTGPSPPPPPPPPARHDAPPPPKSQQQRRQEQQQHEQRKGQTEEQQHLTPALPPLPPSADIRIPTAADIVPLRRINALLLPVSYPDSFYAYAADNPLARVITWSHDGKEEPKVIGGIVCRVEDADARRRGHDDDDDDDTGANPPSQNLYIRSLCLLSPYRNMGLARAALEHVLVMASASQALRVANVTAHVWTENEDGLRWYDRQGFARDAAQPLRGYYLKLRPDTAWLVRRPVSPQQHSTTHHGSSSSSSSSSSRQQRDVQAVVPPRSVTAAVVNLTPGPAAAPPPATSRPQPATGQSFQNQRPGMEWNDLPPDMAPVSVAAAGGPLRGKARAADGASGASLRGASATARKKRDRAYPAAAFGGV